MFDSSPIESWDGAGVFYSFAGTGMTDVFFWLTVILCIVPLYYVLQDEKAAEEEYK